MSRQYNLSSLHRHTPIKWSMIRNEKQLDGLDNSLNDFHNNNDDNNNNNNNNNNSIQPHHQYEKSNNSELFDDSNNEYYEDDSYNNVVFDISKVSADDFASQMTLIDLPLFQKIQAEELLSMGWTGREKMEKAPNIVIFTRRFNYINFWVQREILNRTTAKRRSNLITNFIKIAKRLNDLNNLHSCAAILSALKSVAIDRLKSSWSKISNSYIGQFEKLCGLLLDEQKVKLRRLLDKLKLPCIPHIALYLQDLVYIDISYPSQTVDKDAQRDTQMNNICRIISMFQQSNYDHLKTIGYVQTYLNEIRHLDEFQRLIEDDYFKLSLQLEPHNNQHHQQTIKNVEKNSSIALHLSKLHNASNNNNNNNNNGKLKKSEWTIQLKTPTKKMDQKFFNDTIDKTNKNLFSQKNNFNDINSMVKTNNSYVTYGDEITEQEENDKIKFKLTTTTTTTATTTSTIATTTTIGKNTQNNLGVNRTIISSSKSGKSTTLMKNKTRNITSSNVNTKSANTSIRLNRRRNLIDDSVIDDTITIDSKTMLSAHLLLKCTSSAISTSITTITTSSSNPINMRTNSNSSKSITSSVRSNSTRCDVNFINESIDTTSSSDGKKTKIDNRVDDKKKDKNTIQKIISNFFQTRNSSLRSSMNGSIGRPSTPLTDTTLKKQNSFRERLTRKKSTTTIDSCIMRIPPINLNKINSDLNVEKRIEEIELNEKNSNDISKDKSDENENNYQMIEKNEQKISMIDENELKYFNEILTINNHQFNDHPQPNQLDIPIINQSDIPIINQPYQLDIPINNQPIPSQQEIVELPNGLTLDEVDKTLEMATELLLKNGCTLPIDPDATLNDDEVIYSSCLDIESITGRNEDKSNETLNDNPNEIDEITEIINDMKEVINDDKEDLEEIEEIKETTIEKEEEEKNNLNEIDFIEPKEKVEEIEKYIETITLATNILIEGEVRKRCILKRYQVPTFITSKRYWCVLTIHPPASLLFYAPKTFGSRKFSINLNEDNPTTSQSSDARKYRRIYKSKLEKCIRIIDWMIYEHFDVEKKRVIVMKDLNCGSSYELRIMKSAWSFEEWLKALSNSANILHRTPENLINL
ncbi:hypothetical protein SNEBB_007006 [Seison nebaliae]|nr:hypothetical protein SNEBB_007006 [Seison nebaliae]